MARIELKQPGQAVADFSVDGHRITIAGVLVDCLALWKDSQQIIEVRQSEAGAHIGGEGAYLAHITIPAKSYVEVPSEDTEGSQTGMRELLDLDVNAIEVVLWPLAH